MYEVAHSHAQNAPLEQFLSIPGLGVVFHIKAVEQDLLVAYPVIDICDSKSHLFFLMILSGESP